MQVIYKRVSPEDLERILAYCRARTTQTGGLFEVYSDPERQDRAMVVVNADAGGLGKLAPLGSFYCNYLGSGVISLEDDPRHDRAESRGRDTAVLKRAIDALLRAALAM
ncbi:MAG: hypothetical protein ACE5G9_01865 [Nitrospinales bacterium]